MNDGTTMLVALKQGLGKLAGEAADPTGDTALNQRSLFLLPSLPPSSGANICLGGLHTEK